MKWLFFFLFFPFRMVITSTVCLLMGDLGYARDENIFGCSVCGWLTETACPVATLAWT